MRLIALALVLASATAHAQVRVWEKPLVPGFVYRMEHDPSVPRVIHAVRLSLGSPVRAVPELGGETVYEDGESKGRSVVSEMVARRDALGGINGDFFPFTGDPLGLMVREGELLSDPGRRTAAFAWGPGSAVTGMTSYRGTLTADGGESIALDGVNRQNAGSETVLNTSSAGVALSTSPATAMVIRLESGKPSASGTLRGYVEGLMANAVRVQVARDQAVVMGTGIKGQALARLMVGQRVEVSLRVEGFDWTRLKSAIGGAPILVRNGQIVNDWAVQGFGDDFGVKRHPRTAVGRTAAGDLWFVAIDGRSTVSDGASLDETTRIMLRLGCVDALNLDGGGSTTLNLLGLTLNRPTDAAGERPVANGVLFYGPRLDPLAGKASLVAPTQVTMGKPAQMKVFGESGERLTDVQILWGATGTGWIDQGGLFRPLAPGPATVYAWVGGRRLSASLQVVPESAPKKLPPLSPRRG